MTRQKSFKRLVRTRIEKTGESYTAARASLLAAAEPAEKPVLVTSDESIRRRTGAHERLADAPEAERMKAFWRERVAALKEQLER